jgi:hypothetical protein
MKSKFDVIAGLDPAIHLLEWNLLAGWMRGSSGESALRVFSGA